MRSHGLYAFSLSILPLLFGRAAQGASFARGAGLPSYLVHAPYTSMRSLRRAEDATPGSECVVLLASAIPDGSAR